MSGKKPRTSVTPSAEAQTETRVYLRKQCILGASGEEASAEFLPALGAIFLPVLIGKAIEGASSALRKAGSEQTLKDSGQLLTYLLQLRDKDGTRSLKSNPDFGCVIVVRGTFKGQEKTDVFDPTQTTGVTVNPPGIFTDANQEAQRVKRLNDNKIPVQTIALEYEAKIMKSNDETALYYDSKFLEVNEFQGSRHDDARGIVISIAINGAGAKEADSTLSLSLIDLGDIKKGTIKGENDLKGHHSVWLGGLGLGDSALKAIEKIPVKDGQTFGVVPITIQGLVAETDKGNKTLLFIADVLSATSSDVSKALSSQILDAGKREQAATDAAEKAQEDEESAYAACLAAVDALHKVADPTTTEGVAKTFDLERTKRIWQLKNNTLKQLGIPVGDRAGCK
jgi:hypothetical protein